MINFFVYIYALDTAKQIGIHFFLKKGPSILFITFFNYLQLYFLIFHFLL